MVLTQPTADKLEFEKFYLNKDNEEIYHLALSYDVIYRITETNSGEILDIGETGTSITTRQNGRFRESEWREIARQRSLSIEIMHKSGRINRKEAETAYLKNYKNQNGQLPRMNRKQETTSTVTYTEQNWVKGIRNLAREMNSESEEFGVRNLTRGRTDSPNKMWKKISHKFRKSPELLNEVQVLFDSPKGIVGLTNNTYILFSKGFLPFSNFKRKQTIRFSSMYIDEEGEIGYWDYEQDEAIKFNNIWVETFDSDQTEFMVKLIQYALRTKWK